MSQEIVRREEDFLDVGRLDALQKLGAYLAKSGMFPNIRTPEQAMTIVQYGRELGWGPIVSLQEIFVVNGRLAVSSKNMLALFQMSGGKVEVTEWTDAICKLRFSKTEFKPLDYTYTMEDARKEGLDKKDRWMKSPRTMLYWRAISNGIRAFDPRTTMGLSTPEEIEEIIEDAPGPGYKAEAFEPPAAAAPAEDKPETPDEIEAFNRKNSGLGVPGAVAAGPIPPKDKPAAPKEPRKNALTPKPSAKPASPPTPAPPLDVPPPQTDPDTGQLVSLSITGELIQGKIDYILKEFGKDVFTPAKNRAEGMTVANRPLPDFPDGLNDREAEEIIKVLDATIRAEEIKRKGGQK